MFNKFKSLVSKAEYKLKNILRSLEVPITNVVIAYFLIVIILVLTYYIAWLHQCHMGKIVMSELLAIIQEMIGPAMIGFVTFIAGCFIDTNHNGIPDRLEGNNYDEESNSRHYPRHRQER